MKHNFETNTVLSLKRQYSKEESTALLFKQFEVLTKRVEILTETNENLLKRIDNINYLRTEEKAMAERKLEKMKATTANQAQNLEKIKKLKKHITGLNAAIAKVKQGNQELQAKLDKKFDPVITCHLKA